MNKPVGEDDVFAELPEGVDINDLPVQPFGSLAGVTRFYVEPAAVVQAIERCANSEDRALLSRLLKLLDLALAATGDRLRVCVYCGRFFLRSRRQIYCRAACSQAVRTDRWLVKKMNEGLGGDDGSHAS